MQRSNRTTAEAHHIAPLGPTSPRKRITAPMQQALALLVAHGEPIDLWFTTKRDRRWAKGGSARIEGHHVTRRTLDALVRLGLATRSIEGTKYANLYKMTYTLRRGA